MCLQLKYSACWNDLLSQRTISLPIARHVEWSTIISAKIRSHRNRRSANAKRAGKWTWIQNSDSGIVFRRNFAKPPNPIAKMAAMRRREEEVEEEQPQVQEEEQEAVQRGIPLATLEVRNLKVQISRLVIFFVWAHHSDTNVLTIFSLIYISKKLVGRCFVFSNSNMEWLMLIWRNWPRPASTLLSQVSLICLHFCFASINPGFQIANILFVSRLRRKEGSRCSEGNHRGQGRQAARSRFAGINLPFLLFVAHFWVIWVFSW